MVEVRPSGDVPLVRERTWKDALMIHRTLGPHVSAEWWVMRVVLELPEAPEHRAMVLSPYVRAINADEYMLLGRQLLQPIEGYATELEAQERALIEDGRNPRARHKVILNAE